MTPSYKTAGIANSSVAHPRLRRTRVLPGVTHLAFALLMQSCGIPASHHPRLFRFYDENWRGGYIDATGKEVISPQFAVAGPFSEGLAAVKLQGGSRGYIDEQGRLVVGPSMEWWSCGDFSEGCAVVVRRAEPGFWQPVRTEPTSSGWFGPASYIDRGGKRITERWFQRCLPFSEGLGCASDTDGTTKYLDRTGKVVLTHPSWAMEFSEGLAAASDADSTGTLTWGFIDRRGRWVIPPRDEFVVSPFREGLAQVLYTVDKVQQSKYVDRDGRTTITGFQAYWHGEFSEGLAAARMPGPDARVVYIDRRGQVVLDPVELSVLSARPFSEGLAAVRGRGGWGYLDKRGRVVVPCQYDEQAGPFRGGLAWVSFHSEGKFKAGYVNRRGKLVYEFLQ